MHLDPFWASVSDLIHFFHAYAAQKQLKQIFLQITAFFSLWFLLSDSFSSVHETKWGKMIIFFPLRQVYIGTSS